MVVLAIAAMPVRPVLIMDTACSSLAMGIGLVVPGVLIKLSRVLLAHSTVWMVCSYIISILVLNSADV